VDSFAELTTGDEEVSMFDEAMLTSDATMGDVEPTPILIDCESDKSQVCVYVCMYVCVCVCECVCVCMCACMFVCASMCACMHV
jgi:hypothetical protein